MEMVFEITVKTFSGATMIYRTKDVMEQVEKLANYNADELVIKRA